LVNRLLLPYAPHLEAGERASALKQWSHGECRVGYLALYPTSDHGCYLLLPFPCLIGVIDFSHEVGLTGYLEHSPFAAAPQQLA
jgi:hypothetical protein